MLQLRIRTGHDVRSQAIAGDAAALGRAPENDVVLQDDSVSRRHARLIQRGTSVFIQDLGGANGTGLNGDILHGETREVGPSDTIVIGPFQVRVIVANAQPAPPPQGAYPPRPSQQAPVASPPAPAAAFNRQPPLPAVNRQPPTAAAPAFGAQPAPATPAAAHISVRVPDGQYSVPILRDELTIGRGPTNDVVVEQGAVSVHHAVVRRRGPRWEVVDLHSRNGTFVGGKPIESALLNDGDVFTLADSVPITFIQPRSGPAGIPERLSGTQLLRGRPEPVGASVHAGPGPGAAPPSERKSPSRRFIPHAPGAARITVGRALTNDLVLDSPQVSREHAVIERAGPSSPWQISDLQTTNRSYVNNEAITVRMLADGDVIRIGPFRLTIRQGEIEHVDETAGILLEARTLRKVVGHGVTILNDVSLAFEPHEFVGIVGVSGAGKSTLLGALSGLRPATSGDVLLNGFSLYQHFDSMRAQIGYVPQDDITHRELSVERALDYAARLRMPEDLTRAERKARVNEVLDELDLQRQRKTIVASLSGGQRKRVSIGVELLTKPPLFFLDEPTSGLDPGTETRMMGLLRQLADQGRTVLLITHATRNIHVCDRVVFMARGGRLAFCGPPREALTYFGVGEFEDVYDLIENQRSPEEWENAFKASRYYDSEIVSRMAHAESLAPAATGAAGIGSSGIPGIAGNRAQTSALRQFAILTQRYADIVLHDRKNLLILLMQAPIIGLLLFVLIKPDVFNPPGPYTVVLSAARPGVFKGAACDEAQIRADNVPAGCVRDPSNGGEINAATLAFILAATGVWLGTLNAIREISKEDAIYRRERVVNLRVVPYIISKLAVLTVIVLIQTTLLIGVVAVHVAFPGSAVAGIWLSLALGGIASVAVALAISAAVSNPDRAVIAAPLVMLPQIFFGGLIFPDLNRNISTPITTRWTYEAIGRAAHIYRQAKLPDPLRKPSLDGDAWPHWLVLGGFVLLFSALAVALQRLKDRR